MTITVIIVVITFLVSLHPLKISCFYLYVFVSLSAGLLEKSLTNFDKKILRDVWLATDYILVLIQIRCMYRNIQTEFLPLWD